MSSTTLLSVLFHAIQLHSSCQMFRFLCCGPKAIQSPSALMLHLGCCAGVIYRKGAHGSLHAVKGCGLPNLHRGQMW